ncbi:MAG: family oxidoreductase [Paenibacillus sp.]|jgi:NAD(P)-dependent dehydrogenase (short-subunit alcohol dehydrogenase family)|nr:family oxidoreductase [Paenibacillus sp.]
MHNRVAVVTGAAGGIGKGIAEVLLREGCRVVIADWNEELGRQTAEKLTEDKNRILFLRTDVANPQDIQRVMDESLARWGAIDVWVNNVGTHYYRKIEQVAVEDWDRVMATDLRGHFLGIQKVLPHMKSRGGGAIVNISSIHALQTLPGASVYAAAKGGMMAMSRSLALEAAPYGVRVNTVLPGKTRNLQDEARLAKTPPEERANQEREMARNIPLGRIAEASEIGETVAFLASDRAAFITGTTITVDGGESCHLFWNP